MAYMAERLAGRSALFSISSVDTLLIYRYRDPVLREGSSRTRQHKYVEEKGTRAIPRKFLDTGTNVH